MTTYFKNLLSAIGFSKKSGFIFFKTGIFLLPSAPALSAICLFLASIFGSIDRPDSFFKDKWNFPFILGGGLMILSCCFSYLSDSHPYRESWDPWLSWVGLLNWIPFFWCFWAFQPYLLTGEARKSSALWFVAGSIPVLVTGFGQYWFGWHGPFELFNGLIIWFQRPIQGTMGGLTGLFNNPNYAGSWLTIVWPFSLAALLQPSLNALKKIIVFLINSSIVTAIILTNSRNAWGGLLFAVPFVLGPSSWGWLIPVGMLILVPIFTAILPFVSSGFQDWSRSIVHERIWLRLGDFSQFENYPRARIDIWNNAIKFISKKPIFGWGAAAFPILYKLLGETGFRQEHTHNLPLELAISYGIPASLFIFINIFILLLFAIKLALFKKKSIEELSLGSDLFDRAWLTSSFFLICTHMVDIPYFDVRISLAFWVLLSGLRAYIRELSSAI